MDLGFVLFFIAIGIWTFLYSKKERMSNVGKAFDAWINSIINKDNQTSIQELEKRIETLEKKINE